MKYFLALALALSLPGCGSKKAGIRIGLSLDTLKEERWQRDRDMFSQHAQELGAEVLVQAADSNDALQNSQAENLLTQGVDVLVVVPHNGKAAASIVEAAHKAKVPVIAYDRLINDCDLDLYVSFDAERIGAMQAQAMLDRVPTGNYVVIEGAPTDNNARLLRNGQMKVLDPLLKSGAIKIVADQWATDWAPGEALKIMENALTKNSNKIDAVIASNDGTAGGAIQALEGQNLAGKVPISGQDADLAACKRIVAGTQTSTIYKPLKKLAFSAAELAIKLAKKESVTASQKIPNGKIEVPSVLLDPISVDKSNLEATVIADGFHPKEAVFGK
jgi:D-xylose transport system substrate-binding protein